MTPPFWRNDPGAQFIWSVFLVFSTFLFSTGAGVATEVSCKEDPDDPCHPIVLAVLINGVSPKTAASREIFVFQKQGRIFVTRSSLLLWQLKPPTENSFIRDNLEWIALDEIPGLQYSIRESTQELLIQTSGENFTGFNTFLGSQPIQRSSIERGSGFFLNYDVNVEHSGKTGISGLLDANAFGKWGLMNSKFLRRGFGNNDFIRLETTFIHDLPNKLQSLRIGDSQTVPGAWGRSVFFGGVQWKTDFGTQPDMVYFPLPSVRGEAVAPSTAELYINNILRWSEQVAPGPFEIQNPPLISGPGQATLVINDVMGRQVVTTQPYFSTSLLLRPGLNDFSISAGKIRTGFGTYSDRYGRSFFSGSFRRGLNNRLTVEMRGEATSSLIAAGATVTSVLWGPIIGKAGWVNSNGNGLNGQMFLAGLELQSRRLTIGAQTDRSTKGFRQLGLEYERTPPRKQDRAFLGLTLFRRENLTLSYFRQEGEINISYATASLAVSINQKLFWTTTATTSVSDVRRNSLMTGLVYQIGNRNIVTPVVRREGNRTEAQLQIQRNRTFGPGIGYRLQGTTGEFARIEGDTSIGTRHQDFLFSFFDGKTGTALRGGVQGAIAFTKRKAFITRRIEDSFAVVKVGQYAGVEVLADNQSIGTTDRNGLVIVPRLLSYQENRISINPAHLPLDASFTTMETQVRPARRNGVNVDFNVRADFGALIRFELEPGKPVPLSAQGVIDGSGESFFIGNGGLGYLTEVSDKKIIKVKIRWKDKACTAEFSLPENREQGMIEKTVLCSAH